MNDDRTPHPTPGRPAGEPNGLPDIPGYEIVRELGRGGMGVVFVAASPA